MNIRGKRSECLMMNLFVLRIPYIETLVIIGQCTLYKVVQI